jgi:polysaccharide biosynthesis transport protein
LIGDREAKASPTLLDYLQVLRRRKWSFVLPVVVVPVIAVALTMRATPAYVSSAQVLLNQQNLAQSLVGIQAPYSDPARTAATEAELARVQEVAQRAIKAAGVRDLTPTAFLKSSSVLASATSDFLTFSVTRPDPASAERLATSYAQVFSAYRQELNTQAIDRATKAAREQINELEETGLKGSAGYQSWVARLRQLTAVKALQTPATQVVQVADRAVKMGPRTVRNGMIGLTLGVMLGLVLAFVREALDTRVRSVETIRKTLGLRLLGRLPAPSRQRRREDSLVMLTAPMSHEAEPFRILRTSFEFANSDKQARTIMFTSAVDGEGKSTTAANLAVALARAGRFVVLVDFDLRSPDLHRLFDLEDGPGLIDVELGNVELEDALRNVPLAAHDPAAESGGRPSRREGRLEILPAGHILQDPDELGAELAVARLVDSLRDRADFVLIDAAPLLRVGDAIALSAHVDALLLVVRRNVLRSSTLDDLRRILSSSPTAKLGFVLTGTERDDAYAYKQHQYASNSGRRDTERGQGRRDVEAAAAGQDVEAVPAQNAPASSPRKLRVARADRQKVREVDAEIFPPGGAERRQS